MTKKRFFDFENCILNAFKMTTKLCEVVNSRAIIDMEQDLAKEEKPN